MTDAAASRGAWVRALARRPGAALFALLLGTYAYFYQAGGWNQNSRIDLVRAMVEDHQLTIDRFEKNTGDDSRKDGHYYCDKAPGASWLCTPPYAIVYWLSGSPAHPSTTWLGWAVWLSIVVAIGVPAAIAAVFLVRLARALSLDRWHGYALALVWSLATMALPYSTLLYGNQLSGSLLIIGFTLLVELRHAGASATPARMLAIGGSFGLAGAVEYPAMLVVMPMAAYGLVVVWRRAGWRPLAWAVLGGAVPLGALALYHTVAFGSPGTFPYKYSVWKEPSTGVFMGIGAPKWPAMKGTFWGQHRGLLYVMPWLVLMVPGAIALGRRYLVEVLLAAWAVIAFVWLNVSIKPWHGGWATGPRYVVPMLPFAVLLCGGVLVWTRGRARAVLLPAAALVGAAVLWSGAHMFAATVVKPEIDEKIKRPYSTVVWKHWWKGDLAISRQSIDMVGNPPKGPKQAWNLGQKAGLPGHASLVPLYLWWALCAWWLVRALRRTPR
ncbi:MAG: hypothetical protein JNK64_26490 [Myxococcales bacterium]|nr:hypothetical protein [Myxococcales bacterium]